MKNIITLFTLLLLIGTVQGQSSFSKGYMKLRESTKENYTIQTLKGKELQQFYASDSVDIQLNRMIADNAKQITVIGDMNKEGQPTPSEIDKLLEQYEDLTSMKNGTTAIEVRVNMKGDKVKTLLVSLRNEGGSGDISDMLFKEMESPKLMDMFFANSLFFVEISFKKPMTMEELVDGLGDVSQLVSLNDSEGGNNAFIQVEQKSTDMKWRLVPHPVELEIVKENSMYGVKSRQHFVILPKYSNEMIIYRSDSYHSDGYIKVMENDKTSYLLYDQHGFKITEDADEITPIYVADGDVVIYFIVKKGKDYSLYECPEEYRQSQNGSSIGAHIKYRIENCQSITLKDENILECIKADGTVELIAIEKRERE